MSDSSASATSADAPRARTIAALRLSPRRHGERRSRARRRAHLGERAHHYRLAPAVGLGHRDRGPQASVELVAKFRHQPPLILRKLDVPFRDENLAVTRFHPQKTHRRIMPDGGRASLYLVVFEAALLTAFAFFFFFGSGTTRATSGTGSRASAQTVLRRRRWCRWTISSTVAWGTAGVPGFAPLGRYEQ